MSVCLCVRLHLRMRKEEVKPCFSRVHIFANFANFGRFCKIEYTQNFLLNNISKIEYTPNMPKIHILRKQIHEKKDAQKMLVNSAFLRTSQ